jgi:hypothetical protein
MTHACRFPACGYLSRHSQPFPMANALLPSFLPAVLRTAPSLSAFPLRPLPRLTPTFLTAVARHRMPRPKYLSASFQQTLPASRLSRSPSDLLFCAEKLLSLSSWRILTAGAHGRVRSRKAQVSEGIALLSEAPSSIQAFRRDSRTHCAEQLYQLCRIAGTSPPSSRGGLAHSGPPPWPILSPPPTAGDASLRNRRHVRQ